MSNGSQLAQALKNASAGNAIELANGTYGGSFQITKSGTKGNPILITASSASRPHYAIVYSASAATTSSSRA